MTASLTNKRKKWERVLTIFPAAKLENTVGIMRLLFHWSRATPEYNIVEIIIQAYKSTKQKYEGSPEHDKKIIYAWNL